MLVSTSHMTPSGRRDARKLQSLPHAIINLAASSESEEVLTGLSSGAGQELALALVPELPGHACSEQPRPSVSRISR
jgi:hypothetical protein